MVSRYKKRRTDRGQPFRDPAALPMGGAVRSVVEHLPDHLAPDPRVGRALQLDQYRHAGPGHEQMVQRPPSRPVFPIRDRLLAPDQEQRAVIVRDQLGMRGDQPLHEVLRSGLRRAHGGQRASSIHCVDRVAHPAPSFPARYPVYLGRSAMRPPLPFRKPHP